MRPELLKELFEDSLTGKGARSLSSECVEELFRYAERKPFRLQITEAFMVEPQYDTPLLEYSIMGPLPRKGEGLEEDKAEAIRLFRSLNEKAQKERYAIRYNVWFSD